jgi:peptide deformylase
MKEETIIKKARALGVSPDGLADQASDEDLAIDFASKLVPPHKKKSKLVTNGDITRLLSDAKIMYNLCYTQVGYIPGCYAVHHSQIDDKKPLNFFVTADKEVVINPVIINHTKVAVERTEGCLSFPLNPPTKTMRFHKIVVEYQTLEEDGTISALKQKNLSAVDAQIWQHEIQHSQGSYIYDINKK